jgi:hypothetical protein
VEALIIGIATAFNFIVIKWKLEHKRYEDATFDILIIFLLSVIFGGTLGGMIVAMVASAIISLYFLVSPPKFLSGLLKELKDTYDSASK